MTWLIRGARLIDPQRGQDAVADLYLADGRILAQAAAPAGFTPARVIEAHGLAVLPGLTDLAWRGGADPAREAQAALSAGVTRVVLPPWQAGIDGPLQALPLAPLCGPDGRLAEMAHALQDGCVAVAQGDGPLPGNRQLWLAMQYAADLDATLWLRPEDAALAQGGVAAAGPYAARLGLPAVPEEAETVALQTLFTLQRATGARLHLCHLSSAAGLDLLRQARRAGLPVTADATVQHLHLTDLDLGFYDARAHLRPPLRSQRDRDAIAQALADGTLDALCSDHCPLDDAAKSGPFALTRPGASAVELLLSLTLKWARDQSLPLAQAFACLTSGPARVLRQPAATLAPGAPADLCLVDLDDEWLPQLHGLRSVSCQTPFAGMMLPGRVRATFSGGRLSWEMPA